MSLVLIVEDDPAILRGLEYNLRLERHEVLTAADGETGYRLAMQRKPDLAILDLMLPKMSGFEICRKLREEGFSMPILMLTARGEEEDRVLGLDLGADDYVTKPFSIREVLARIRALLRRAHPFPLLPEEVRFDDVVVDFMRYEAMKDGMRVEMTRKEFGVLRLLAAKAGQVVTRDDLLNEVWGMENFPVTRTVDNHIALLRAKLERNPAEPRRFITIHGVGYKFVV
jgi:DNA-binding response OmpR family regulator